MMVAAVVAAALHHRRAAELAAPDDERIVEQPALLEILDEGRAGLVGLRGSSSSMSCTRLPVLIPRFVKNLDEAHAAFD